MEKTRKAKTQKKKNTVRPTVFDDVFRTLCERMPDELIPLINEVFGTKYPKDAPIVQHRNEHHNADGVIVTDADISISGDRYHIECQSTDMKIMIIRMFEYDVAIALESRQDSDEGYVIDFPKSCIVYLRGKDKPGRHRPLKVRFPNGQEIDYDVEITEVESYSATDMVQKDLKVLYPFYILRYENKLPGKSDGEEMDKLMADFEKIKVSLQSEPDDEADRYVTMTELIYKVLDHISRRNQSVKKGVRQVMGGKVLELKSDKMIKQAQEQSLIAVFLRCINEMGMSKQDAQRIAGISNELAEKALAKA